MKLFFSALFVLLLTGCMGDCNSSNESGNAPPTAIPAPTEVPSSMSRLQVCNDSKLYFCDQMGKRVYLLGSSDYGAFSILDKSNYDPTLSELAKHGVNLSRQWGSSLPSSLGGLAPYKFNGTKPILVNEYWDRADSFIRIAAKNGIYVMVVLVDRWGCAYDFKTHPWNKSNGGFLTQCFPDMYNTSNGQSPLVEAAGLAASRLSKHKNVLYELVNEPVKYRDLKQLETFHKALVSVIKKNHPGALLGVNTVPDGSGRQVLPNPVVVGADFVTIHGAGVENPDDSATCSEASVHNRLVFLRDRFLNVPLVSDTDGLHASGKPCNRQNNAVLRQLARGAIALNPKLAGFNHRDFDEFSKLDKEALKVLSEVKP